MTLFNQFARSFIVTTLCLLSGMAFASGVTSAPSEASSETSSKQSSEGTSGSSSDSSPERNNFVANNLHNITLDAARNGGPTLQALAFRRQLSESEVAQRIQNWMITNEHNAPSADDINQLLR